MACKASFELHHNFPKLADEAGFTFNTHRPRVHIEWSKIKLIDIESLVRNRNFVIVEQHLNDILDCVIDLEFDVRILDEGFLKIFRLAQLAVEYQQFCRHYLDRSVFVLKEEITSLLQELDTTKKNLKEKEEEIRKIKRKMKSSIRTPLPYGNDNIASMILNTLNQTKSGLFASPSQADTMNYNKCNYCEKVFLNQLYLKSHISRRHGNVMETPQKDNDNKSNNNSELNNDIVELKSKLKQMEDLMLNMKSKDDINTENANSDNSKNDNNSTLKEVKDAEVMTNDDVLERIEQWKKEEQGTCYKEINLLRTQILDIINNKEKDKDVDSKIDLNMIEQLQNTIKNQGEEILTLKQELLKGNTLETEERLRIQEQLNFWSKKAESQTNEFKILLKKLNDVENEAREYRAQVEAEKEKSTKLQILMQQNSNHVKNDRVVTLNKSTMFSDEVNDFDESKTLKSVSPKHVPTSSSENVILKRLQQRAQELLDIDNISSSDTSSDKNVIQKHIQNYKTKLVESEPLEKHMLKEKQKQIKPVIDTKLTVLKSKKKHDKKCKDFPKSQKNIATAKNIEQAYISASPVKVVRAKVTEEVNNRLVQLGIDPLKNKLPKSVFLKQRMFLRAQQEIKLKKVPEREKVLHSIMSNLNANASKTHQNHIEKYENISPNKSVKTLSMSNVLSNVKTKALSLVKSSETTERTKKSYQDIAKKALALLKTSQEQTQSSPIKQENSFVDTKYAIDTKQNTDKILEIEPRERKINIKDNPKTSRRKTVISNGSIDSDSSDQDVFENKKKLQNPKDKFNTKIQSNNDEYENKSVMHLNNKNNDNNSSDDIESLLNFPPRKALSEDNINDNKKTKGVLKNASSTSSLNKKRVIFDMDAIQVKSVSASPSQSTTEKSDNNEQYALGIDNLDTEEWDLSSIENLELPDIAKDETKVIPTLRQSQKFTELKQTIESKLMRRNHTLSTTLVGGVDVLSAPLQKASSLGGSNTSLGSSILDDTDSSVPDNTKNVVKSKYIMEE